MVAAAAKTLEPLVKKLEKSSLKPKFMEPLDRLVLVLLCEAGMPLAEADKAMKRLMGVFADYNEARVSRWVEIARAFDPAPHSDRAAQRLRDMLHRLFDLRGELTLEFLREMKITEAKKALGELDREVSKDALLVLLFQCVPGMTPPVTPEHLSAARKHEIVGRSATKEQLQKLLSAEDHENAAKILHYLDIEVLESRPAQTPSRASSRSSSRHTTAAKAAKS